MITSLIGSRTLPERIYQKPKKNSLFYKKKNQHKGFFKQCKVGEM